MYGTLKINANTDNSGTEYVLLTAGKGLSETLTDGLAIGSSTLQWQGKDVIHGGNISSQSVASAAKLVTNGASTNQGDSTTPVYFSGGTPSSCTKYAGASKVTVNGVGYTGKDATFYAPTAYGTAGNVLRSSGSSTSAPTWSSAINIDSTHSSSVKLNNGSGNTVHSTYALAAGSGTAAYKYQTVVGCYNDTNTGGGNPSISSSSSMGAYTGSLFMVGNGYGSVTGGRSNAFRVAANGKTYAKGAYASSGADYAEYFEWEDLNPNKEDRRGYFVTIKENKIRLANPNDYILGIVSGNPAVIGNGDECWMNRYALDEFGGHILEEVEIEEDEPEVINEATGEIECNSKKVTKKKYVWKQNPDYDPSIPYIQRANRPEWDAVGMVGVLAVRDDGTCQVNGYCKVAAGGIATAASERTLDTYRVIERVNDHIVKVILK
jgi:hypothetical protein